MPLPSTLTGTGMERSITTDSRRLIAYPNPVGVGQTLYIETDTDNRLLQNAVIEVYNLFGQRIGSYPVQGRLTTVHMERPVGIYVIVLKINDEYRKGVKVIVK